MNHIGARIAASTWQDVFFLMSAVVVVNFALLVIYLLVTCTVHFIRRLWWVFLTELPFSHLISFSELSKSSSLLTPDFQFKRKKRKSSQVIFGSTKNQPVSGNDHIYKGKSHNRTVLLWLLIKVNTYRSINWRKLRGTSFFEEGRLNGILRELVACR